jgi:hypothetical protein
VGEDAGKTKQSAREHLDWFKAFLGGLKVSELRVHHVNDFLKSLIRLVFVANP